MIDLAIVLFVEFLMRDEVMIGMTVIMAGCVAVAAIAR